VTTSVEKKVNGASLTSPEPRFDPVALAEAEAIRTRAAAEAEALRKKAEGDAKAAEILAAEQAEAQRLENEKQALANERAALRFQREQAEQHAKIAEAQKRREDVERARAKERRTEEEQQEAEEQAAAEVKDADDKWRSYAIKFAVVCGIVSLPVQMSFFWNPKAPWMAAAPIMLEGAAWVVHRGARAAVANRRPVWHYRTIVWLLALIAAGVNLYHGLHSFDPGTAAATAFASIAGPGVWDLHEHGRIRKRDGVPTRRERKAAEKAAKAEAAQRAADEEKRAADKQAAEAAAEKAREELTERRKRLFPKVWEHAEKLAADLGEIDPNTVWARAKLDVEGAKPGESADIFRMRNAAEARVEAAREKRSVNGSTQQVASQVPGTKKPRVYNPPARRGKRTKGDVKFAPAARRQASITAKNTRPNDK
jgi:hypothetical protein